MKTVKASLSLAALAAKSVWGYPHLSLLLTVGNVAYVAISFWFWISPLLVRVHEGGCL